MNAARVLGAGAILSALVAAGCNRAVDENFLGSAVVEGQTFQVTATAQGKILSLFYREGDRVEKNSLMAVVDTVPYVLQLRQLEASVAELQSNRAAKQAEISALESDVGGISREFERIGGLVEKGSAPSQQRDNLKTQLSSARFRLEANRKLLAAFTERERALAVQRDQVLDQLGRCFVRSPARGIVLTRFRNLDEVAGPGMPIFEVGQFDTLYADFFVPQPVVASLNYGQTVRIRIDFEKPGSDRKEVFLPAVVNWIGDEAEFSPKNIQTRESRNELVFRVRATIANTEGILKRGLPVEVWRDVGGKS